MQKPVEPKCPVPGTADKHTEKAIKERFVSEAFTDFVWTHGGKEIKIAGSFTHWKPEPMRKAAEGWVFPAKLGKGEHLFKFVVDGEWKVDHQLATVTDSEGNTNNVVRIPEVPKMEESK